MASRRHFSFFWMPYSDSAETLFLESPGGVDLSDHGFIKRYDERDADAVPTVETDLAAGAFRRRIDRPYRIYPDPPFQGEIVQRELEYMVRPSTARRHSWHSGHWSSTADRGTTSR